MLHFAEAALKRHSSTFSEASTFPQRRSTRVELRSTDSRGGCPYIVSFDPSSFASNALPSLRSGSRGGRRRPPLHKHFISATGARLLCTFRTSSACCAGCG